MKFLKTFENFESENDFYKEDAFEDAFDDMDGSCEPCNDDDDDDEMEDNIELPEPPMDEPITLEKKGTSYKKSGLKNPEKADLNKDKKISTYEKKRGKAIQSSSEEKEEKGSKGLTAKQKKLPEGLRKAIEKRMKK
jgi:hypothetical protein